MFSSSLKSIIKKYTTAQQRLLLKKNKRHCIQFFIRKKKVSLAEIKTILVDKFEIKEGDSVIITSSFGNINADFSPKQLIELLQEITTSKGTIIMPYYPPMNSTEWASNNYVFDMESTKSGMGVLTNIFSIMPNVIKSIHPTKALCVWGKNAEDIIMHHELSTTPYYSDSPYGKLFKENCKSIGIGCKNMPIIHSVEDLLSTDYSIYYQKKQYCLRVITKSRKTIKVTTYVHDDKILSKCMTGWEYANKIGCNSLKTIKIGYSSMYVINNLDLLQQSTKYFKSGKTRFKNSWNT